MATIRLFVSNSMRGVMDVLVPDFRQASGHEVSISYDPAKIMMERIRKGESADLAILGGSAIPDLEKMGKVAPGSRRAVSSCGVGVAMSAGARKPDIGTVDAFKRALLAVKSIAYTEQGASGMYFAKLIDDLGIGDAVRGKAVRRPGGLVGELVAAGKAELAVQQIVGPFPKEVQMITKSAAAVLADAREPAAAKAFLDFLLTPASARVIKAKGHEPAQGQG
jgi:molybdate transport system substrate-binding protein